LGVWEAYWERSMALVTSKAGDAGGCEASSETEVEEEAVAWASWRWRREAEEPSSSEEEEAAAAEEGEGIEASARRTATVKGSSFCRRSSGWWTRRVLATYSAMEPDRPPFNMRRRSFHSKDASWERPEPP
jgi:hypothetical protein